MAQTVDHTRILDMLAEDPNGWSSALNRADAHMIIALRKRGVSDEIIHAAITEAHEAVDRIR